jgi:hypothetical protein
MRSLAISIISILTTAAASAHPDHVGDPTVGIAHYVTDPFHITLGILTFAAAVLLMSVLRARHRRSVILRRRP